MPPCNADDNVRSLQLVLAAYESHERGASVQMSLWAGGARHPGDSPRERPHERLARSHCGGQG